MCLGGTGYCRVFFDIWQLVVLSFASETLPACHFLALYLSFSSSCQQQYILKLQQTGDKSAVPLLFFTELDNLHVLLGNLIGYASFQ